MKNGLSSYTLCRSECRCCQSNSSRDTQSLWAVDDVLPYHWGVPFRDQTSGKPLFWSVCALMVGPRPWLGGSSRKRHVGPQDGLKCGLMNLLLRQNSNAQLSSQGRASDIKNPSRIIRRRGIHLLAQNQVFERIFWTTVAATKIDDFAQLGHAFEWKIRCRFWFCHQMRPEIMIWLNTGCSKK